MEKKRLVLLKSGGEIWSPAGHFVFLQVVLQRYTLHTWMSHIEKGRVLRKLELEAMNLVHVMIQANCRTAIYIGQMCIESFRVDTCHNLEEDISPSSRFTTGCFNSECQGKPDRKTIKFSHLALLSISS